MEFLVETNRCVEFCILIGECCKAVMGWNPWKRWKVLEVLERVVMSGRLECHESLECLECHE